MNIIIAREITHPPIDESKCRRKKNKKILLFHKKYEC